MADTTHPALNKFECCIVKRGNRYEVPLMIKESALGLYDNRPLAEQRLRSQLRRFSQQPNMLLQHDSVIREYFQEEHAERVTQSATTPENIYYLPHHAVIRRDAVTTKLRAVFDAPSHVPNQPSLNAVLESGPKLDADLLKLIITLRSHLTIPTDDIRKAYSQIFNRREGRDALRFLWDERLPNNSVDIQDLVEWRITRVPFGASSSPFLLAATLQHHFNTMNEQYPNAMALIRHSFYVDDLVVGTTSEAEALTVYQEANEVFEEAVMQLRKWTSRSLKLQQQFRQDGKSYDDTAQNTTEAKVLGMLWNRVDDEIFLRASFIVPLAHPPLHPLGLHDLPAAHLLRLLPLLEYRFAVQDGLLSVNFGTRTLHTRGIPSRPGSIC